MHGRCVPKNEQGHDVAASEALADFDAGSTPMRSGFNLIGYCFRASRVEWWNVEENLGPLPLLLLALLLMMPSAEIAKCLRLLLYRELHLTWVRIRKMPLQ